jgi:citronellol/citronellal dehydrogenase
MAKYGMSMCVLGMAEEFRGDGHRRQRAVAAHRHRHRRRWREHPRRRRRDGSSRRKPEIMADAAHAIFCATARECTGNFFIDDEVLAQDGRHRLRQVRRPLSS